MRNSYFDILKGIAIIFVIAIHTYPIQSTPIPLDFSSENIGYILLLMIRQFIVVAVPLFCTISGFFLGRKTKEECIQFIKTHSLPLYIPTLIWGLPFIAYDFYKGFGNWSYNIFRYLCCGYSIHYFIAIMLQFYLISPFLVKIRSKNYLLLFILISCMGIGLFSYLMYIKGLEIPLYIYAGTLPIWIMFFCLGIYLAQIKREYNHIPFMIGAVLFYVASYFETKYYLNVFGQLSGIGYKITNFVFSFFLIIVLMSKQMEKKANHLSKTFTWLGRNSLGIYFAHYPLLVFVFCHIKTNWFTEFALSLSTSIIMIMLSKKILRKRISSFLGFR